ncbi:MULTISPECIES: glycoside hydrolase family 25 protein [Corynebacterium]|uniref:glycoside hydrolase family 25 protein n=1 Tax=Corynebacterium TaxID=1716 RepID=UPI0008A23692|nr:MULTISPECIES: glycoside hydrolase family 25 protein [Corynebacterium]MCQ9125096.1 glycoside hydrolase family 25 protein [Corynebacterium amycolatum]MDC7119568.1 glycoside hydrolase family 25 protein [Corynebacterium amycolatum]MDK8727190.1 glycoside hydrolase family 25 protein [Corynebacterium amycolatum]MDK8828112.1 glycoside hydrolase family 25 protein [Corynebacterium sp. MSK012]OFR59947.1 lysozyme M1 [Corynebacterium sp. HMSC065H09]
MKFLPLSANAVLKRRPGRATLASIVAVAPLTLGVIAPADAQTQDASAHSNQSAADSKGSLDFLTVQESQGSDANGSSTGSATSASSNSARTGFNMGPTGVDVSKWQRPGGVALKWDEVAASGQKFAFIKATDGVEGDQKYFLEDSIAAAKAGLYVGSYHKAHPDRSAIAQADQYVEALQQRDEQISTDKTLPPVLDIELDNGLNPTQLQKWTKDFLERVEEKTGETPMIYTYRWFWQNPMGNSTDFTDYPLWLAAYEDSAPTSLPGGWESMAFWQRSSTGRVDGIPTNVDEDVFNGTEAELQQLAAAH